MLPLMLVYLPEERRRVVATALQLPPFLETYFNISS